MNQLIDWSTQIATSADVSSTWRLPLADIEVQKFSVV